MKKLLLVSASVLALGVSASSGADLPKPAYKAPPPPVVAPIVNWTGIYIGGHFGWAEHDEDWVLPADGFFFAGSGRAKGFLGGGQAGLNWQVNRWWLVGLQGDISGADITGLARRAPRDFRCWGGSDQTSDCSSKAKWLSSFTVRAGFLPLENVLLYVKGGVAWQNTDFGVTNIVDITGGGCGPAGTRHPDYLTTNQTRTSGTIGGGAEVRITSHITAFAEYDFADFRTKAVNFVNTSGDHCVPSFTADISQKNENIVKVGVNFLFNFGKAPLTFGKEPAVTARY